MKRFAQQLRRFLISEDGPTAVEYSVIIGVIILVCIVAIIPIGSQTNVPFNNMANSLGAS
jgi:pilus assembly protein Flp/PilA